jgi:serine/threonine protein kinase
LERNNIIEEIVGEAGVMACLRHPKILQLYGCSLTMQAIWIVSEFCSRGSLRMLLNDSTLDLPFLKKVSICLDVADGMLYLHTRSPPIIHRDIKSHNIFITEPSPGHFVAKIGDWGSARAVALTGNAPLPAIIPLTSSKLFFLCFSVCLHFLCLIAQLFSFFFSLLPSFHSQQHDNTLLHDTHRGQEHDPRGGHRLLARTRSH